MNRIRVTLISSLAVLLFLPLLASAQSNDGSIEASWDRAASERPVKVERPVVPSPAPAAKSEGLKYTNTAWDAQRSGTSRPWPKLSASSTAKDYFDTNTAVIDSLSRLYCLSSNYISTLRIRNTQAMQGRVSTLKDFNYEEGQAPATPASARSTLHALHKELMQLLERCLIGR